MAVGYQKAYKVRDGSLKNLESHYTTLGEEACKNIGGTWYNQKCLLGVESPDAEKYNKLAKAFNDRLTSGIGDTTWRLFFYVHSLTRTMVIPPLDSPQPGLKRDPFSAKENGPDSLYAGGEKIDHHEDLWWKLHSHIQLESWDPKDKFKEFGQYVWPTGSFAKPGGANPANPLVAYVLGTGKNGANITNNWHNMRKMPPEWFRLGMVPISFFPIVTGWEAYTSDYPLWYFDEDFNPSNDDDPNNFTSGNFSTRHRPISLTEKWVMAKLQRGAAAFASVDGIAVTGKLRAEAPAYFAPRIYHKFDYNWRSPHGKYAPSYAPSADIKGYCPPSDPRFPPSPRFEYKFQPINPSTHSNLSFPSSCGYNSANVTKVRRMYDHYEVFFAGGFHLTLIDRGGGTYGWGTPQKGPLSLPYKHYIEGSYEGGGTLGKREAYHDQIDQISNYFNSGFRKTPEMSQSEKGNMVDKAGDDNPNITPDPRKAYHGDEAEPKRLSPDPWYYDSVGEATFDLPTYNFEFEKFFRKQYSLAPAYGGSQSISTKDGEIPRITPRYPRFRVVNASSSTSLISSGLSNNKFRIWMKKDEGYGPYTSLGITYFIPTMGFCVAGYYAWGTGIEIKHTRQSGEISTAGNSLTFKINKRYKWSSSATPTSTNSFSVSVMPVRESGFCSDNVHHGSIEDCLTVDGRTFIQEGIFQKMYYFAAGEEIANSRMDLELIDGGGINFLGTSGISAAAIPEIVFEIAHLVEYKPDLPDSLALLRIASTGKGSKIESVENEDNVWFGPLGDGAAGSAKKSRGIGIDTRGKDMDYSGKVMKPNKSGTDSDDDERKPMREPFDIWQEYNTFGYIPNIMGALELPDKMAKGYNKDTDYTHGNLTANAAEGGDPFQNNFLPINLNPVYDAARELYGDNLRMIPRTQFVDYRVDEDCEFCANEYYTTKDACIAAGYPWGGKHKRDKSVLTFERYINGIADAGQSELGGMGLQPIGTITRNGSNTEQPKGGD